MNFTENLIREIVKTSGVDVFELTQEEKNEITKLVDRYRKMVDECSRKIKEIKKENDRDVKNLRKIFLKINTFPEGHSTSGEFGEGYSNTNLSHFHSVGYFYGDDDDTNEHKVSKEDLEKLKKLDLLDQYEYLQQKTKIQFNRTNKTRVKNLSEFKTYTNDFKKTLEKIFKTSVTRERHKFKIRKEKLYFLVYVNSTDTEIPGWKFNELTSQKVLSDIQNIFDDIKKRHLEESVE